MLNTLGGFKFDHSCFTPVSMVLTHNARHSIKKLERPKTGFGLNSFKCLGPKLWSSVPKNLETYKKISLNTITKNSC